MEKLINPEIAARYKAASLFGKAVVWLYLLSLTSLRLTMFPVFILVGLCWLVSFAQQQFKYIMSGRNVTIDSYREILEEALQNEICSDYFLVLPIAVGLGLIFWVSVLVTLGC